jgi:hypothetical protein
MQKIKEFFKNNSKEIILAIFIILISLLSFALGFIVAKFQEKKPLKIEKFQVPNSKQCPIAKIQLAKTVWSLEFGI